MKSYYLNVPSFTFNQFIVFFPCAEPKETLWNLMSYVSHQNFQNYIWFMWVEIFKHVTLKSSFLHAHVNIYAKALQKVFPQWKMMIPMVLCQKKPSPSTTQWNALDMSVCLCDFEGLIESPLPIVKKAWVFLISVTYFCNSSSFTTK